MGRHWPQIGEGRRPFLLDIVVVVSVLLALGAQQLVSDHSGRGQVHAFRAAVDDELGFDLHADRNRINHAERLDRFLSINCGTIIAATGRIGSNPGVDAGSPPPPPWNCPPLRKAA